MSMSQDPIPANRVSIIGDYSERSPAGHMVWDPHDGGGPIQFDTAQCRHCQAHFLRKPIGQNDGERLRKLGISNKRLRYIKHPGFCAVCNSVVCDQPQCQDHHACAAAGAIHSRARAK